MYADLFLICIYWWLVRLSTYFIYWPFEYPLIICLSKILFVFSFLIWSPHLTCISSVTSSETMYTSRNQFYCRVIDTNRSGLLQHCIEVEQSHVIPRPAVLWWELSVVCIENIFSHFVAFSLYSSLFQLVIILIYRYFPLCLVLLCVLSKKFPLSQDHEDVLYSLLEAFCFTSHVFYA